MHLRSVELTNFRAYTSARFDLPATGLTFVVGPNNSGKSALLTAIDVLAGLKPGAGAARAGMGDRVATIRGQFVLTDGEREQVFGLDPNISDAWRGTPAFGEMRLTFRDFNADRMWLEIVEVADAVGDLTQIAHNHIDTATGNFVTQSGPLQEWVSAGPKTSYPMRNIGTGNLPDQIFGDAMLYPLNDVLQAWRRGVYTLRR